MIYTQILIKGGAVRKNTVAGLLLAVALALSLTACQDTKARQENEQLKAQVQQLQKENGELGNRVDGLTKETAALREENERLKARHPKTKTPKPKRRRSISKRSPRRQN
jgi:outer membrane murein-binding lipoprotein Lpp